MSPGSDKGDGGDWVRVVREAAPYLGLGTSLAGAALLPIGVGWWLDREFGAAPGLTLCGALLGLVAAGVQFVKEVGRKNKP
ncbi:MAG: AtpZ/AtpI family protein [Vicinamibacteria bacterium]|nr:AtpZ/AtpI family protein [Vicinamibacteria bacterium]